MLTFLFEYLSHYWHGFAVFQYVTLRIILALITAGALSILAGGPVIRKLRFYKVGQTVRDDGPQAHLAKTGTPTMGGVLIIFAMLVSSLLWCKLNNAAVWVALFTLVSFGLIGAVDDYKKLVLKNPKGLASRWKYFWQSILAVMIGVFLYQHATTAGQLTLYVPFVKSWALPLGAGFMVLCYFVVVGSSNAVNLTDGLDGLAIVPAVLVGGALGIFAYLSGHAEFARYLLMPHISEVAEIAVFCGTLVGAGLGFLWFNAYPAEVFMGDVGSLSLGAVLGVVAVLVRQELLLFLMGGIFVIETLSVIIQVAYFKRTKKRIFKMSPIHHHFELCGWPEPKVIVRFWIITALLVMVGLASLKIR